MVPLREVALPKVSGTTYTYTFPAISQGEAASVTVSIPGAPPTASWTIYAGPLPVASLAGANAITGLYLSGGEQCSIVGTSPTSPGWAVEVGQLGSLAEVPVTSPSPSASAVNVVDIPTYTTVASVAAASDFVYTIPTETPLRLVAFRATFTASSQSGRRYPYLWQVVAGDTLPTAETLLTPDSIGVSEVIVVDAVPGGAPGTRSGPRRPATGSFGTSVTTLYTAPSGGWLSQGSLFLYNPGSSSVTAFVQVASVTVAAVSIGPTLGATVTIPELQAGDVLTATTSAGTVDYTLSGQENGDTRRVTDFSGLLLPPGSTIQTATGGLQSGDQWTDINLAFVQS